MFWAAQRLKKLGFVFQFHFLLPEFSALENVMIPMRKLAQESEQKMRARATRILEELGLAALLNNKPDQLSALTHRQIRLVDGAIIDAG